MTIECARGLLTNRELDHVLLVDNGSGGADLSELRSAASQEARLWVVPLPSNLGYAAGMQTGIRAAIDAGASFVWLVNNDCVLEPPVLGPLLEEMTTHPETAACSGIIDHEGYRTWSHGGGSLDLVRGKMVNAYSHRVAELERYTVDWVPGVAWLLRVQAINKVGGLDCRLFLYGEECDWCYRTRQIGYEAVIIPAARFRSLEGATALRHKCTMLYYELRNQYWLLRRQGTLPQRLLHDVYLVGYRLPRLFVGLSLRRELRCLRLALLGFLHGAFDSVHRSYSPSDAIPERLPALI
jgi:GT2 family glycosyltransferase